MYKSYKYRLYPNKKQQEFFAKCFGCARFIYNHILADKIKYYEETKQMLKVTPAKYKDEFPWLREVDSFALVVAERNLATAFNNFFKRPEVGFPKFKSKKGRLSYTTCCNREKAIYVTDKHVRLPKIGLVRLRKSRELEGKIKSATISKNPSGKYFISILVECEEQEKLPKTEKESRITLGGDEFCTVSDGTVIENPRYLEKSEKKLKKLQNQLSRCQKGSKNWEKRRVKLARLHEKIANQRRDFLHKLSKRLIDENQVIVLEDLCVKDLMKDHESAKCATDAAWAEFSRQLEYKASWYGREFKRVN